ncbi:MAG: lipopolysaccharide biosynthesis protein [Syntrophales bacterium]
MQESEPLSAKVVRSGIWAFALRSISRLLGFLRTVILARLLTPGDFGILGIAMLTIHALETFSETGFESAIVQKKEITKSYLDTAWTVTAFRGILLFTILFFSAPTLAGFFNSPESVPVIRVVAVSTILTGLRNTGIVFFQKNLEFHRLFIYELPASLIDLTISVWLAFVLENVWALVWGGLAGNIVRFLLSFALHPYRPCVSFDKKRFRELFGFGKWVVGSGILIFLITQGDNIFAGKLLGAAALGLYQMAFLISHLASSEISYVVAQVAYPAYSRLQDDISSLRDAYLKVLQITVFISAPIACMIFVLAPEFTDLFLGHKWMEMVPAMRILVMAAFVSSIIDTSGHIFYAVGKPGVDTQLQIVRFLVLGVSIYPLSVNWGLPGISLSVFLSILVSALVFSIRAVNTVKCGSIAFLKKIFLPLVNGMISALIVFGFKNTFSKTGLPEFFLLLVTSAALFLFMSFLSDRFLDYRMRPIAREMFILLKGRVWKSASS